MANPLKPIATTRTRRFVMTPRRWAPLSAICFLAAAYYLCYEYFPVHVTKDTPLYRVTRNGKQGIVTTGGRIVVPFEWNDVWSFDDEGMACVVLNQPPLPGKTVGQSFYGVISHSGNVIIPATLTDSSWKFDDHNEYQGVRDQQLINFDGSGKEKWRSDWLPVGQLQCRFGKNGLMAVRKGNETGWLDRTGQMVLRPPERLMAVSNFDTAGLAQVQDSAGRLGCIDEHGTIVIEPTWDSITCASRNQLRNGRWQTIAVPLLEVWKEKTEGKAYKNFSFDVGMYAPDGTLLIKAEYPAISVYPDIDLIVARQWDGLMGCFDSKGNLQIPFQYEDIVPWTGTGLLAAKKGGKYGWINTNGETVLPFDCDEVNRIIGDCPTTLAFASRDGRWGAINQRGETIVPFQYGRIFATYSSQHFIGKDDKTSQVFDSAGKPVGDPIQIHLGSFFNLDEWLIRQEESAREPGDGSPLFEAVDERRMPRGAFHVEKGVIVPVVHHRVELTESGMVGRGFWSSDSFVDQYASFAKEKLNKLFPAIVPSDSELMVQYDFDGNMIWRSDARLFDFLKAFGLSCWGLYCLRRYRVAKREQRMLQAA